MTTLRINIEADNAAFTDQDDGLELARILRGIADDLEAYGEISRETLRDINGNAVGEAYIANDMFDDMLPALMQRQAD